MNQKIEKYKEELNTPEVNHFVKEITQVYLITEKEVKKLLIEERVETNNMHEAILSVIERLKFYMV